MQLLLKDEALLKGVAGELARKTGFTLEELSGKSRKHHLGRARRQVYRWLRAAGYSYPQIGRVFNRDHSTIVHAIKNR